MLFSFNLLKDFIFFNRLCFYMFMFVLRKYNNKAISLVHRIGYLTRHVKCYIKYYKAYSSIPKLPCIYINSRHGVPSGYSGS